MPLLCLSVCLSGLSALSLLHAHLPCPNQLTADAPTCDEQCSGLLRAVDEELGCCYAEAVRALDNLPDHIVDPDMVCVGVL